MRHRDRKIRSVGDMLRALKQQARPKQLIWFRGQSRKEWTLVPGLARNERHLKAESALIKRFMQNAAPHIVVASPRDEWEWIFLMQHHRAETTVCSTGRRARLPRFTSPYERKKHSGYPAALWCLDPVALNHEAAS